MKSLKDKVEGGFNKERNRITHTIQTLQYEEVPPINLSFATTKVLDSQGHPVIDISWYDSKLWVQENDLVLPTSREWHEATVYFRKNVPKLEHDMLKGPHEFTDSLIAWPHSINGNYASNLNPRPRPGKYPLLIEDSIVEKVKDGYVVDGGERIELPNIIRIEELYHSGFFSAPWLFPGEESPFIPELGLRKGLYVRCDAGDYPEQGLRHILRCGWVIANKGPSDRMTGATLRPAQKVTDKKKV